MTGRTCKNCKWWIKPVGEVNTGPCSVLLPFWFVRIMRIDAEHWTGADEGHNCKTFKPRGGKSEREKSDA